MRALAAALLLLVGCEEPGPPPFTEPQELGGVVVSSEVLNAGRDSYGRYCRSCHGPFGDGKGALGIHQEPPARDLRLGIIEFGSVPSGSLPRDEDIARIVKRGIPGTAMLPWAIADDELDNIVQYIKTFAPRWRSERAGDAVVAGADPWIRREAEAVARGAVLYNGVASCGSCHPGKITDSPFGRIVATDFSKGFFRGGSELVDIYRAIAAGIGGTAMPAWKTALPEADLWALAYYVKQQSR